MFVKVGNISWDQHHFSVFTPCHVFLVYTPSAVCVCPVRIYFPTSQPMFCICILLQFCQAPKQAYFTFRKKSQSFEEKI